MFFYIYIKQGSCFREHRHLAPPCLYSSLNHGNPVSLFLLESCRCHQPSMTSPVSIRRSLFAVLGQLVSSGPSVHSASPSSRWLSWYSLPGLAVQTHGARGHPGALWDCLRWDICHKSKKNPDLRKLQLFTCVCFQVCVDSDWPVPDCRGGLSSLSPLPSFQSVAVLVGVSLWAVWTSVLCLCLFRFCSAATVYKICAWLQLTAGRTHWFYWFPGSTDTGLVTPALLLCQYFLLVLLMLCFTGE